MESTETYMKSVTCPMNKLRQFQICLVHLTYLQVDPNTRSLGTDAGVKLLTGSKFMDTGHKCSDTGSKGANTAS